MYTPLILLNYPIDKDQVLLDCEDLRKKSRSYTDYRMKGKNVENWTIIKYSNSYIEKIINDFEVEASPRIYFLKPFAFIPDHVDNSTKCSINFILSEKPAPIKIEKKHYSYTQALLDTTKTHSVLNGKEERILLKLSIFNETFENIAYRIKFRL